MNETKNVHAVALGRLGGLAGKGKCSPRKLAAARANGRKGGPQSWKRNQVSATNKQD